MELFSFPDKLASLNLPSDKISAFRKTHELPPCIVPLPWPVKYIPQSFPHPFNPDPTWKWGSTYMVPCFLQAGSVTR